MELILIAGFGMVGVLLSQGVGLVLELGARLSSVGDSRSEETAPDEGNLQGLDALLAQVDQAA
jgi:hypothetical protein